MQSMCTSTGFFSCLSKFGNAKQIYILAVCFIPLASLSAQSASGPFDGAVATGKKLYAVQCAYCHGAAGKGDGEASDILFPRPRDFTHGEFRLRSTPKGSPPADEDLFRTITFGIPGSAMPGFAFLADAERRSLVQYIKTLSPRLAVADGRRKPSIDTSSQPPSNTEMVEEGHKLYEQLQCTSCHGNEGKGDGNAVKTLQDDEGFPVQPRNFTTGPFKGGASVKDIFLRISTGMEGTPMTSYGQLGERERWQLAYYVQSLCKGNCEGTSSEPHVVMSARSKAILPLNNPFSPAWNSAPQVRIPLISLWNRGPAQLPELKVRSLTDGKTIVFLVEWDDSSRDVSTTRPQDFRDSVALQFFAGPGNAPIAMGDRNSEVTIWQWKADWQEQVDGNRSIGMKEAHPFMVEDTYPRPAVAALEAGNQNALARRVSSVEEATARGFGTITPKPAGSQHVMGTGIWRDGKWHVVLYRARADGSGIATRTSLSFAIWNGSESQRNGEKAVSNWHTLVIGR
jgi:mono/diheme cytochrome c family protein